MFSRAAAVVVAVVAVVVAAAADTFRIWQPGEGGPREPIVSCRRTASALVSRSGLEPATFTLSSPLIDT